MAPPIAQIEQGAAPELEDGPFERLLPWYSMWKARTRSFPRAYRFTMSNVRATAGGIVTFMILLVGLAGCSDSVKDPHLPNPSSSTRPAANSTAAAKQAISTYISAVNGIDFTDTATFEAVYETVAGGQRAFEEQQMAALVKNGWTSTGSTLITLIEPIAADDTAGQRTFAVCLDLSDRRYFDANGEEQGAQRSSETQALTMKVIEDDKDNVWRVSESGPREGQPSCS